jgi:hypothetical protein
VRGLSLARMATCHGATPVPILLGKRADTRESLSAVQP